MVRCNIALHNAQVDDNIRSNTNIHTRTRALGEPLARYREYLCMRYKANSDKEY